MTKDELKEIIDLKVTVGKLDTKLEVLLPNLATKDDIHKIVNTALAAHKIDTHHKGGLSNKQIAALIGVGIPLLSTLTAYLSTLLPAL